MNDKKIITQEDMMVNVRYGKDGHAYGLLCNAIINGDKKFFQLVGEGGNIYTFNKDMVDKRDQKALEEKVQKLREFRAEVAKHRQSDVFKAMLTR